MRSEQCPDLERLAAFVDGRLERDDATRVAVHAADCARCREIVAETVRSQEQDPSIYAAAEPDARLRKVPAGDASGSLFGSFASWGLAAAAIVLVFVGVRSAGWFAGAANFPSQRTLEGADWGAGVAQLGDDWNLHQWPTYRGSAPPDSVPSDVAFRVGVLLVDLQVVAAANRDPATELFLLQQTLQQVEFTTSLELAWGDADLTDSAERAQLERATAERMDSLYFEFGRWAQAMVVALGLDVPDVNVHLEEGLEAFAGMELRDEVRVALEQLVRDHAAGDVTAMRASLRELIRLAGQS